MVLGDKFMSALDTFLTTIGSGQVIGGAFGIPGTVLSDGLGIAATTFKAQLQTLISKKHKVE